MVEYELIESSVGDERPTHLETLALQDLVNKALNTLDEKLRVPIVFNIYSGMDLSEISEVMGIPEGTVKSRLFTARKKIKEYLDSYGD